MIFPLDVLLSVLSVNKLCVSNERNAMIRHGWSISFHAGTHNEAMVIVCHTASLNAD